MKISRLISNIILSALLLSLAACAGGRGLTRDLPQWVISPPQSDDENEYFVVSAGSDSGNLADAEEAAALNLLGEINRVLGVDISMISDAQARGTLESYEAEVVQSVQQQAEGRISGLRIVDRYVIQTDSGVTVYILASYERSELESERRRRQALLEERRDAVAVPEEKGVQAESAGRLFEAFRFYADAAVAASSSDIRNSQVKLERNLQNAQRVLANMELSLLDGPDTLILGEAQQRPFRIQVLDSRGRGGGVTPFVVSYRESVNNRGRQVRETVSSDSSGIISYRISNPGIIGRQFISFYLDADPVLENLRQAGLGGSPQFGAMEDVAADIRVRFEFEVVSRASEVPTAVFIREFDIAGNTIDSSSVHDGFIQELSSAGFTVVDLRTMNGDFADALELDGSRDEFLSRVRNSVDPDVQRVIFGNARIVEVDERDGFIVRVQGSVTAVDLSSNRILATLESTKNSRGASSSRAVSSAFANLGSDLAGRMLSSLR